MRVDFPTNKAASPRLLTIPLSWLYSIASKLYHERFDRLPILQYKTTVPVISVGNITVGGTGKTPCVIALAKLLTEMIPELNEQDRIAVLSRGYGRLSKKLIEVRPDSQWQETGDEPILIKRSMPHLAVVVHADRRQSSAYAINRLKSKLLILDDGFQHRAIARNMDIVLLAGTYPLGNGRQLPAGPLRESPSALERASLVVGIGQEAAEASALAEKYMIPFVNAVAKTNIHNNFDNKSNLKVFVLTSIANPTRFITSLPKAGLNLCGQLLFPDHHPFQPTDLERIYHEASRCEADVVLTTEKDQIRLSSWSCAIPLQTVGYELEFIDKQSLFRCMEPILRHLSLT